MTSAGSRAVRSTRTACAAPAAAATRNTRRHRGRGRRISAASEAPLFGRSPGQGDEDAEADQHRARQPVLQAQHQRPAGQQPGRHPGDAGRGYSGRSLHRRCGVDRLGIGQAVDPHVTGCCLVLVGDRRQRSEIKSARHICRALFFCQVQRSAQVPTQEFDPNRILI